jgi:diguanylate cyclase (GGDEF)-like protein
MKPLLESLFLQSERTFGSPEMALETDRPRVDMSEVLSLLTHSLAESVRHSDEFHRQLRDTGWQLAEVAGEDAGAADLPPGVFRALHGGAATIQRLVAEKENADRERIEALANQLDALRDELREARLHAQTDPLTGVLNRRAFDTLMVDLVERCKDGTAAFALVLFDIDDFKRINDHYGHLVGDRAIRVFTQRCRAQLRPSDYLARYGGEEFVAVIQSVSLEHAHARARSICRAIAATPIRVGRNGATRSLNMTVSAGVSRFAMGDAIDDVIHRADQALYLAKARGKNCALCEHDLLH